MKKTLHGRRHLRARKTVEIGRVNRRVKKTARFVNVEIPRFIFHFKQSFEKALPAAIAAATEMASALGEVGRAAANIRIGE